MMLLCIKAPSGVVCLTVLKYRLIVAIKESLLFIAIVKFLKKLKGGKLTNEEKGENCRLSYERILIENINAKNKVFKIMKNPYRNRRK